MEIVKRGHFFVSLVVYLLMPAFLFLPYVVIVLMVCNAAFSSAVFWFPWHLAA